MLRFAGFALASLVLTGCASTTGGSSGTDTSSRSANVQFETQAFVDAVYRLCVPSVELGSPYEELEIATSGQFRAMSLGEDSLLGPGQPGMYRTEAGVVQVDNSKPDVCVVSAYGLPVAGTFAVINDAITQSGIGYLLADRQLPARPKVVRKGYIKDAGDERFTVFLSGSEPGAEGTLSRFSVLNATVRRSDPEN